MGTPYPLEKKNQILGRILSKEITVEQAHREYSIATSCVYRWSRQLKADSRSGGQGTQAIPLPQGMNFRAALVAEGASCLPRHIYRGTGDEIPKHFSTMEKSI